MASCCDSEVVVNTDVNSIDKRKRIDTSENVLCAISIPSRLLIEWRKKISSGKAESYIAQLNDNMKIIQIKANIDRVEGRLQRLAGEVSC